MTCIAWDGRTLAADKRASNGGLARRCTKIMRHGDALIGMTGDWDAAAELRQWWIDGAKPADFPKVGRDDKATLVVVQHAGISVYVAGPFPMIQEEQFSAWGSGRDFAIAAMHLGCDAAKAVEVASIFQHDCGDGVDTLTF